MNRKLPWRVASLQPNMISVVDADNRIVCTLRSSESEIADYIVERCNCTGPDKSDA